MTKLLVVQASPAGEGSSSRRVSDVLIARLLESRPGHLRVDRDLALDPVPHLSAETVAALGKSPDTRNESERASLELSDRLCQELIEADEIVIGAAMWNFSVPSVLKAWIDHLVRVGVTFRYGESGPVGLLPTGKRLFIVGSSGGEYPASAQSMDHAFPYLVEVFRFMGIERIEFIPVQGTAYRREAAVGEAIERVRMRIPVDLNERSERAELIPARPA